MSHSDINQSVFQDTLSKFPESVQVSAKMLFEKLDLSLDPQIAVVAVPFSKSEEMILVNTDGIDYQPEWFVGVRDVVDEIPQFYFDSLAFDIRGVLWGHKVEILEIVQQALDERGVDQRFRAFTTFPEFMHNHSVSMILQLSEKALESHYSLSMNSIRSHPKETSLIHETIVRFLYSYSTPLKNISEGRLSFHGRGHEDELLREAGSWLMRTTERAIGDHGSISLFHACNAISSLRYEGSESVGRMIVSSPDHLNVNISVHLQKSISMDNFRGIRKLLELASGEMHLLCDSRGIYGVGKLTEIPYDENAEDLFIVEFTGHHTWILLHAEHQLMVVRYGLPSLPSRPIDDKTFRNQTKAVFPRLTEEDLDGLWSIVNAASRQKHGTMFVISDHAEQEAKRLKNQSTPIKPVQLTPEMILPLSSIDGALLIDPKSVCYSIGIILDGVATEKGDPGRGARDNSAIRYHDLANKQKHKCLIVVISEDGMIDLIGNMFGA